MIAIDDPKVWQLAQAIAKAEGFYVAGSLPARINNPGDLELGDKGFGTQASKTVFKELADGWTALCRECWMMLTGISHFYNPSKTFFQIAVLYTGNDNAPGWAMIVSGALGLTAQDTLQKFLDL